MVDIARRPPSRPKRLPQIIELGAAELRRDAECARQRNRLQLQGTGQHTGNDGAPGRAEQLDSYQTMLAYHELGAQGESAMAKLIGIIAPLQVDTFHDWPDLPPDWDVKTQLSASKNTRDGYLRLRPRDFQYGRRHVLIERDISLDGRFIFAIHGWISNDEALEVARTRYANSPNRFVNVRYLQPVEPLCQLDEAYWQERAARWYSDDTGELRAHDLDDQPLEPPVPAQQPLNAAQLRALITLCHPDHHPERFELASRTTAALLKLLEDAA